MIDAAAEARAKLIRWRHNVAAFAYENFQFEPDVWQREVFDVFPSMDPDKQRISLQACVGPGKSAALAICGWNFLSCYGDRGEHPKGAAVSVTGANLDDNLWPEFKKWQNRSEFLSRAFTWTKTRIFNNDHPETWFISARSFAKTATAEDQGKTLSGLHSQFVLALIDESGEIPLAVAKAAEQALSNCTFGKIMQAGNPSSLDGILHVAATTQRHLWHVIRITGDPDDPRRSPRIGIEWAREQIKLYGRDNPWVMYSILGMFPPASINALFRLDQLEAAMSRHLRPEDYDQTRKRLGVDAARFGDDPWCIFPRQGLAAFKPIIMRNPRTHDVVARIIRAKHTWGETREFLDDTGGYAAGVIDGLIQAHYSPTPVNFSEQAHDARYFNRRAEMYFRMSEWVERAALPPDPELMQELLAITYTFKGNKMLIEPKDIIKAKLGRSPNKADALALTHAEPDEPAFDLPGVVTGRAASDWDPHEDRGAGRALSEWEPSL